MGMIEEFASQGNIMNILVLESPEMLAVVSAAIVSDAVAERSLVAWKQSKLLTGL